MTDRPSFLGRTCALCRSRPSTRKGEHVVPGWWRQAMTKQYPGPFTSEQGGVPKLRRDGSVWESDGVITYQLPCCEACNQKLNSRFENRAKRIIQPHLAGGAVDAAHAEFAGLWWLKTAMLFAHPETMSSDGRTIGDWWGAPESIFDWVVTGERPPSFLSMWITTGPKKEKRPQFGPLFPYRLGQTFDYTFDGEQRSTRLAKFGINDISIQLMYHPGFELEHPMGSELPVLRVWPRQDDLGPIPVLEQCLVPFWATAWGGAVRFGNESYGWGSKLTLMHSWKSDPLTRPRRIVHCPCNGSNTHLPYIEGVTGVSAGRERSR